MPVHPSPSLFHQHFKSLRRQKVLGNKKSPIELSGLYNIYLCSPASSPPCSSSHSVSWAAFGNRDIRTNWGHHWKEWMAPSTEALIGAILHCCHQQQQHWWESKLPEGNVIRRHTPTSHVKENMRGGGGGIGASLNSDGDHWAIGAESKAK